MQCAAIEFARNVCGIKNANSTEFDKTIAGEQQVGYLSDKNDQVKTLMKSFFLKECSSFCRLKF